MDTQNNRQIRLARLGDIPGILEVLAQNHIANKSPSELEDTGFLLHGFNAADLKKVLAEETQHILMVAIENEQVIGYALSYDKKVSDPSWFTHIVIDKKEDEAIFNSKNTLYHRHIARLANYPGTGAQLLKALLHEANVRAYQHVFCQIVHAPHYNKPSIAFHQSMGFRLIGKQNSDAEYGIYLKSLAYGV